MAAHGEKTATLAVRLFDLTSSLHGLGRREREWLEHAARLHDIGHSIHYRGHHKHSQYLIETAGLDGFDEREIEVIAQVARYHRGARPRLKHPAFGALRPWQRRAVVRLTALLRVADALDRTHAGGVDDLRVAITRRKVADRSALRRRRGDRGRGRAGPWGALRRDLRSAAGRSPGGGRPGPAAGAQVPAGQAFGLRRVPLWKSRRSPTDGFPLTRLASHERLKTKDLPHLHSFLVIPLAKPIQPGSAAGWRRDFHNLFRPAIPVEAHGDRRNRPAHPDRHAAEPPSALLSLKLRLALLWPALAALATRTGLSLAALPGLFTSASTQELLDAVRMIAPAIEVPPAGPTRRSSGRPAISPPARRCADRRRPRRRCSPTATAAATRCPTWRTTSIARRSPERSRVAKGPQLAAARRSASTSSTSLAWLPLPMAARWIVRLSQPIAALARLERRFLGVLALAAFAALLAMAAISWWLDRRLFVPLADLIVAAREIGDGEYDTRFDIPSETELATLGLALSRIARRAQEQIAALAAERDHLHTVVDSLADGVLVIDRDGRADTANPVFRELLGTPHRLRD